MRVLSLICVAMTVAPASAQEQAPQRVEVVVSSVSHLAVFIDKGSAAGIAIGDRLRFFPAGALSVEGVVRAVTAQGARVELLNSGVFLTIGTRGTATLLSPIAEDPESAEARDGPTAPPPTPADEGALERQPLDPLPWSAPLEDWAEGTPLLAPAKTKAPDERAPVVHGRFYTNLQLRRREVGDWLDSGFARTGVDVITSNPFGRGGELRFDGELNGRFAESNYAGNNEAVRLRLDRMYYLHGGRVDQPMRSQFGRFQQHAMPEFGIIDGVELSRRNSSGGHLGASAGHVPVQTTEWPSQDDYQAAVYYRHISIEERPLDWRVGYQKTWHGGAADRDLVVMNADYHVTPRDFISSTGWVDLYGTDDGPKDSGPELTRLFCTAGHYTDDGGGVRAQYSEFRYPYMRRLEYTPPAEDALLGDHVTRLGASAWTRVASRVRLEGRIDRWRDDDDDGYSVEGSCDWGGLLPGEVDLSLSLFDTRGSFSEVTGMRLGTNAYRTRGAWGLMWELSRIQEATLVTADEDLWQQLVRASYDTRIFDAWTLSATGEALWGDQSRSWTLGLFLQRSF